MFRRATILAAAILWAGSAQAATQIMTQGVSASTYTGFGTANQFDPAMGTLLGVQLTFNMYWSMQDDRIDFTNIGSTQGSVSTVNSGYYSFSVGGLGAGGSFSESETHILAPGEKVTVQGGGHGSGEATATDISPFIGTGTLNSWAYARSAIDFNREGDIFFSVIGNPHPQTIAGATLTYIYDDVPPAVPEPATWAMMIAGFGLVGGAMRRRSTATARAA